MKDPFIGDGFAARFSPGIIAQFGAALTQSAGPIHWAGTETATEWRLYMEGAVQSGQRAALQVLRIDKKHIGVKYI
ncbi:FAD-dependent oxidoreductase [Effusibacillus consociatus]|uniref:FAD-dependent oxidoreductase n=1 Tax=Effusibacillus consociatus TaxID=1117041 RepID=A0ABV9Q237_9BACL